MHKYPSVTIIGDFDNGRESVLGDIGYVDDNTLTIHFDEPVKGTVVEKDDGIAIYMGDVTYLIGNIAVMGV